MRGMFLKRTTVALAKKEEYLLVYNSYRECDKGYVFLARKKLAASVAVREHRVNFINSEGNTDPLSSAVEAPSEKEATRPNVNTEDDIYITEEFVAESESTASEVKGGRNAEKINTDTKGCTIKTQQSAGNPMNVRPGNKCGGSSLSLNQESGPKYECPNCTNIYRSAGTLKLHVNACFRNFEALPEDRTCTLCDKTFRTATYLKEHMKLHNEPNRCTRCSQKFTDEEKLMNHVKNHRTKDRLAAEAKALTLKNGGRKMVLKEFTCRFCSTDFEVAFEKGKETARFTCNHCLEKYSNKERLKERLNKSKEIQKFDCGHCGRKFKVQGFLQRHEQCCNGTQK